MRSSTMTDSNAIAHKYILQQRASGTANQKALAVVQARRPAIGGVQAAAPQPEATARTRAIAADNNLKARKYLQRKRAGRMAKTLGTGVPPETEALTESERAAVAIDEGRDRPTPGSLGRGSHGPLPKTLLGMEGEDVAPPLSKGEGKQPHSRVSVGFRLPHDGVLA
jgi:hypothetical protein